MSLTDPLAIYAGAGLGQLLLSAFLLGVLHGVTPNEHTWPITLSYAIGAASGRR
jgi:ABC-type nickel/cobalt efflux system permease component RcnA